jgi:hypothetical protein
VASEYSAFLIMERTVIVASEYCAFLSMERTVMVASEYCAFLNMERTVIVSGSRGSVVVKALCYKPEGREFDTRCSDFFKFT